MKEWRTLFNEAELAIIDSINVEDTLGNLKLLEQLLFGLLYRNLGDPKSKDATKISENLRRVIEKIGELQGEEGKDPDSVLDERLEEYNERK